MKRLISIVMLLCLIGFYGCGSKGGESNNNGQKTNNINNFNSNNTTNITPPAPVSANTNTAKGIEELAKKIYDAVEAKEDLTPYIIAVMEAFDVPVLGNSDLTIADARLKQGLPLFTTTQAARMADAYKEWSLISVESFASSLAEQGVKMKILTSEPTSLGHITSIFGLSAWTPKEKYGSGEVLPAFVIALGKERAKRIPPEFLDPVWGDGNIDPLQFTLMLYRIMSPAASPFAKPLRKIAYSGATSAIGDFVKDQIRDKVTGEVQDFVEIPLDQKDAAQVSVCASLLLYGHKVTVTTTPKLLYRQPKTPNTSMVSAKLEFMDDYYDNYLAIDRWMLENVGNCKLPRKGPVPGKPIEWSVSSSLEGQGDYDVTPSQTNDDGEAVASWRTEFEYTPESCRTFKNQRDAVGAAIVRVGNLVPGWSTLERIVGFLKDTGNTGESRIEVIYYDTTDDPDCDSPHPW